MSRLKLFLEELSDKFLVENFKRVRDEFKDLDILNGNFKFFEITIPRAMTNLQYPHHLGFLPKDILQTSLIGTGTLVWNYSKFTQTELNLTTTGPCVVRAYIGLHKEE